MTHKAFWYIKKFESELQDIAQGEAFKHIRTVTCNNVGGLYCLETIKRTGRAFELHRLLLEALFNIGQHPKLAEFDNLFSLGVKNFSDPYLER